MTRVGNFRSDDELLSVARAVLAEAGYVHEMADSGSVLLAENTLAVVALAATPTLVDLVASEAAVEAILYDRLRDVEIGPKRWDAYVVLLSQEAPSEHVGGLQRLYDINYDTRGFRRIAQVGVEATIRGVQHALAALLEPARLEESGLVGDPLDSMSVALTEQGIDREIASRAIDIFRQGGRLDDAL